MIVVSVLGLYSVLSPATRSNLSDIALILGFVIALATALAIVHKFIGKYLWMPVRWFWRRGWGRNERGVWMTPTVRVEHWLNDIMQPAITKNTETVLAEVIRTSQDAKLELGIFRRENADQHTGVEERLKALEDSHHVMSERLVAVETALRIRSE